MNANAKTHASQQYKRSYTICGIYPIGSLHLSGYELRTSDGETLMLRSLDPRIVISLLVYFHQVCRDNGTYVLLHVGNREGSYVLSYARHDGQCENWRFDALRVHIGHNYGYFLIREAASS